MPLSTQDQTVQMETSAQTKCWGVTLYIGLAFHLGGGGGEGGGQGSGMLV